MINLRFVRVRPIFVYPTINDRDVICQGILTNTLTTHLDRKDKDTASRSTFAYPDYFLRTNRRSHFSTIKQDLSQVEFRRFETGELAPEASTSPLNATGVVDLGESVRCPMSYGDRFGENVSYTQAGFDKSQTLDI